MRHRLSAFFSLLLACLAAGLLATPVGAQQRPLLTEDPAPIPEGTVRIELGIDHAWHQRFPVSGLEGNLLRGPLLGISTALGSVAELQVDGLSWSRLGIERRFDAPLSSLVTATGNSTSSVEDITVGAKLLLVRETSSRPAIGLRFATRLPNAGNEKGLGLDTMDFFQSLLVGKSVGSTRVVGNVGLGILSDPTRGDRQNDVLIYGASVVQAFRIFEVVAEINGRVSTRRGTPPPGTETRGTFTVGVRHTRGSLRFDAAYFKGVDDVDDRSGVTAGLSWTFESFLPD